MDALVQQQTHFMQRALALAERGLGNVWPNPAVGAVIVKDGKIIGEGWTQPGGRPHAEAMALAAAGDAAHGADMYVTLEPCFQPGRGPACAHEIIAAGIQKIFVAISDPHPRVNGQGIAALRAAGIQVEIGLCAAEARELNKGFLSVVERGRPAVTLKLAVSANWKLTTGDPAQQFVTSPEARMDGHYLRANHDAILVGVNTVIVDDPMLDCRIPGLEEFSPIRVVLDRHGRIPKSSKLMQTEDKIPVWLMSQPTILEVLTELANRGITRLLVEGGVEVARAFLAADEVDDWIVYQSPHNAPGVGLDAPQPGSEWQIKSQTQIGKDTRTHWTKPN